MQVVGVAELSPITHGKPGVGECTVGVLPEKKTIESSTHSNHVIRAYRNARNGDGHVPWPGHAVTFGAICGDGGAIGDGEVAIPGTLRGAVVVDAPVVIDEGGSFGGVDGGELKRVCAGIPDAIQ